MAHRPATSRQKALAKALTALIPMAPFADADKIRSDVTGATYRTLPPSISIWLATVAHIRHEHTEYDSLLAEGYDRDAARHFVVGQINETLTRWQATRYLDPDGNED